MLIGYSAYTGNHLHNDSPPLQQLPAPRATAVPVVRTAGSVQPWFIGMCCEHFCRFIPFSIVGGVYDLQNRYIVSFCHTVSPSYELFLPPMAG